MSLINGFFWIILILAAYAAYSLSAASSESQQQTAPGAIHDATGRPYRCKASQAPVLRKKTDAARDKRDYPVKPCTAEFKFFEIGQPGENQKAS